MRSVWCLFFLLCLNNTALAQQVEIPEWMWSAFGASYIAKNNDTYERAVRASYRDYRRNNHLDGHRGSVMFDEPENLKRRARVLTIDTRDQKNCQAIKGNLIHQQGFKESALRELCSQNNQKPMTSILLFDTTKASINVSQQAKHMAGQTGNLALFSGVVLAGLYALPSSVTNWSEGPSHAFENYGENIRSGPVTDKDDGWINYVGHPYAGASYYVLARHAGFSRTKSFLYSAFVSTFIWEYGLEAFAEVPSKQDLWITPVIGSLLGELFYHLDGKIDENGGEVLGSKRMGSITKAFLNPAGYLSDSINKLSKYNPIVDTKLELTQQTLSTPNGNFFDNVIMLKLYLFTRH